MSKVLNLVVNALAEASGAKSDDEKTNKLKAGQDIALDALNLDSLARFEVIMQIEEALDIELDDDEILEQQTVLKLVNFIENRVGEG
jgi:acyl carrier protein